MKNYAAIALVACVAFATLGAIASHAQVLMHAQVPFSFEAGYGKQLPAGDYSISRSSLTEQVVSLSAGKRGVELIMPETIESRNRMSVSKLVFHRYGDEYFLAEIWTNADSSVRMLSFSRRERQLAKAAGLTPQVAVIYGVWPSQSGN